jgi:hypothetical protein
LLYFFNVINQEYSMLDMQDLEKTELRQ